MLSKTLCLNKDMQLHEDNHLLQVAKHQIRHLVPTPNTEVLKSVRLNEKCTHALHIAFKQKRYILLCLEQHCLHEQYMLYMLPGLRVDVTCQLSITI